MGVAGTLENEIAWMVKEGPAEAYTTDAEALAVLFQEALALISQLGVALQTCYRVNPVFKAPANEAETHMVGLVRGAIRAYMPGFLDPYATK